MYFEIKLADQDGGGFCTFAALNVTATVSITLGLKKN